MPKAFTMKKSYLVVFLVSSLVGNAVLLVMLMRSSCFPTLPLHSSTTSARTLKTDGVAGAAQHDKPFQPPSFAYPHPPQPKQYDMFHGRCPTCFVVRHVLHKDNNNALTYSASWPGMGC